MNEIKFECELCLEIYNQFERKPFSLVPCGHCICSKCSKCLERNVCPFCRESFVNNIFFKFMYKSFIIIWNKKKGFKNT